MLKTKTTKAIEAVSVSTDQCEHWRVANPIHENGRPFDVWTEEGLLHALSSVENLGQGQHVFVTVVTSKQYPLSRRDIDKIVRANVKAVA